MSEPLRHIARSPLPWRSVDDNDTECGKAVAEFAVVISWGEASAMIADLGIQRAGLFICMTCLETTRRWGYREPSGQCTFEAEPAERLSRELGKRRKQLNHELWAVAALIQLYRDEFEGILDDINAGRLVPIAELRHQARKYRQ